MNTTKIRYAVLFALALASLAGCHAAAASTSSAAPVAATSAPFLYLAVPVLPRSTPSSTAVAPATTVSPAPAAVVAPAKPSSVHRAPSRPAVASRRSAPAAVAAPTTGAAVEPQTDSPVMCTDVVDCPPAASPSPSQRACDPATEDVDPDSPTGCITRQLPGESTGRQTNLPDGTPCTQLADGSVRCGYPAGVLPGETPPSQPTN